jgi:hypothetical protein
MKTFYNVLASLVVVALFTAGAAFAQERADDANRPSKNGVAMEEIGSTEISVTYGRPHTKGRTIFGGLEPFDKVWRAGANEATTVTVSSDVTVNGETLPAGTYSFFLIPKEEGDWTVIFNKVANQWGAFDYDDSEDVLRVMATPEEADHQEELLIAFEDVSDAEGTMYLHWETTRVPVTFAAD